MFSGLMENLGYYIDNMAREAFITTARRYTSMISHSKLFDYRVKASVAATADLIIHTYNIGVDQVLTVDHTIPSGTIFTTDNAIDYILINDYVMLTGEFVFNISVHQITQNTGLDLGTTNGSADQVFILPLDYAHLSAVLLIGGILWEQRTTLGRSNNTDKHYIIEISNDQIPFIVFGDDQNGAVPIAGQFLLLNYNSTQGAAGNVDENTITNWLAQPTLLGVDTITITNPIKASNGDDVQSLESIKVALPLSLRTLDRAVSKQDYIDTAILAPGVKYADGFWDCGKLVDIYIAPIDGGISSLALLQSTKAYIDARKMWTTTVRVSPSGETEIVIEINITANDYVDSIICEDACRVALLGDYDFDGSNVNRKVRLSDIYALVDNLEQVNFLDIIKLTTKPYARPTNHLLQLEGFILTTEDSIARKEWRLAYDGTTFRLFRDGLFITQIYIGTPYVDPYIEILITSSLYTSGMEWSFVTYPYNENIEFDDFTVPILKTENLIMNITTQP